MAIYSRLGDDGETDLFPWGRISKTDPLLEALGSLDELNAVLGVVRSQGLASETDLFLEESQRTIFKLSSQLSCRDSEAALQLKQMEEADIVRLEREIDRMDAILPPICEMLCFQGPPAAAFTQLARTVCRRAERRVWQVKAQIEPNCFETPISPLICRWLNRFSDFLFTLGRFIALDAQKN